MSNPRPAVLITGGSGLLGRTLVCELTRAGWAVFFTSRREAKIAAVEKEANLAAQGGGRAKGLAVDLLTEHAIEDIVSALDRLGVSLTALVNNARSLDSLAVSDGMALRSDFTREFELGVLVPYELTVRLARAPAHALQAVVNVASMYGIVPPNRALYEDGYASSPVQYGVVKAALIHLTRELAVRFADRRIRVNAVSFGGVEGRASPAFIARYSALTPLGKMLDQGEVAGPVKFLLSDEARSMTGQNLIYDGGYTLW